MTRISVAGLAALAILWGIVGPHTPASSEDTPTYQLRFRFDPGQDWYYVSPGGASYLIEHPQLKDTVSHTSMFLRHMSVTQVNQDGSADVQLVLDRAYMTAKNGGVDSVYNSEIPDKVPTEFESVHTSIGKPQKFRLSPLGKILPIPGETKAVEQVELLIELPEQPIAVGSIWKERFEASVHVNRESMLMRQIKMERRFELVSVENGIATITLNTVCLSPINDPFQESQIIQRKTKGVIRFDIEKGFLVDRQLQVVEKVVGQDGPGSALTVRSMRVDQLIGLDQAKNVDLSKTPVPTGVAETEAKSPQ
jgi:hypothetical protein